MLFHSLINSYLGEKLLSDSRWGQSENKTPAGVINANV